MTEYVCTICEDVYSSFPTYGYCDNTLACAMSDGESLVPVA